MIKEFLTFCDIHCCHVSSALLIFINPSLHILFSGDLKCFCGQLMDSVWSFHPFWCLQRQICVLKTLSNDTKNSPRKMRKWFLTLDTFCCISSTFFIFQCHHPRPNVFHTLSKKVFYFDWFPTDHIPPKANIDHSQF